MKLKSTRTLWMTLAISVCTIGGSVYVRAEEERRTLRKAAYDAAYESLSITFETDANGNEIESFSYGSGNVDTMGLVASHTGELYVDRANIDTDKAGSQTVTYVLSTKDSYDQTVRREYEKTYYVVDNEGPEIRFYRDHVTVSVGDYYDPASNIASVSDPHDGEVDYAISGEVDTETEGTYTVTVSAYDINGNYAESSFEVTVGQKDIWSWIDEWLNQYTDEEDDDDDDHDHGSSWNWDEWFNGPSEERP